MNEPTIRLETRPEVSAFVDQVRARLADLSDEEREELVGGLEADIDELVSDGGSVAELGDPRAYADELRAAAGLERHPVATGKGPGGLIRVRRSRRRMGEYVDAALDAGRRRWAELVDVPALRTSWEFLTVMRPVWWVLRAWVAIQLLDIVTQGGDMPTLLPTLGGPLMGSLVWLVAIVVSVQIGRNRVWPGSGAARRTSARVVILVLNAFAILMTPIVLSPFPASGTWADQYNGGDYEPEPGLMNQEQFVRNVYPYDAQGNPLVGVQLFDENGNPMNIATFMSEDLDDDGRASIPYPWLNGEKELFNVFPLPEREQPAWRLETLPNAWTSGNPPAIPTPPLAAVPPAVLPSAGDGTEVGRTEVDGAGPGAEQAEKQTAGSLRGGDSSAGAADGRRDRR